MNAGETVVPQKLFLALVAATTALHNRRADRTRAIVSCTRVCMGFSRSGAYGLKLSLRDKYDMATKGPLVSQLPPRSVLKCSGGTGEKLSSSFCSKTAKHTRLEPTQLRE